MSLRRQLERKNKVNADKIISAVNKDLYEKGKHDGINIGSEFILNMVLYTLEYKLEDVMNNYEFKKLIKSIFINIDSFKTGQLDSNDYTYIKDKVKYLMELKGDML